MNRVQLVGHLESHPVRTIEEHRVRASFRLATADRWIDPNSQQRMERLEGHRVVCHDRLAEVALAFLSAGSHVFIEGRMQALEVVDPSSNDIVGVEVRADDLHVLCSASQRETIELTILGLQSIEHLLTKLARGVHCTMSLCDLVGMLQVVRARLTDERDGPGCSDMSSSWRRPT